MTRTFAGFSLVLALAATLGLGACSSTPHVGSAPEAGQLSAKALGNWAEPAQTWRAMSFPGKKPTQFHFDLYQDRASMRADSDSAVAMLRREVRVEPDQLGSLKFSWLVPQLIADADMGERDADDAPVRVVLAFEGDRKRFSTKNAMFNELTRAITGEELPYATLMYVWCNRRAPESVIVHPRTDRIRKLVVESGPEHLRHWQNYERDIRADFEKAFGEPPGALLAIGIMTDSDNTRSKVKAWYGPLRLLARSSP